MTVDEFKALKKRVIDRSRWALEVAGDDVDSMGLRFVLLGPLSVALLRGTFKIQLHFQPDKGGSMSVYEEKDGFELQLRWSHKELVRHYNRVLDIIAKELVLEDLASV